MPITSEIGEKLTQKVGPLPAWGWAVAIIGGYAVFRLFRPSKKTDTLDPGIYDLGSGGAGGTPPPGGSGEAPGGGGGGTQPTPVPVPTPTPTPTPVPTPTPTPGGGFNWGSFDWSRLFGGGFGGGLPTGSGFDWGSLFPTNPVPVTGGTGGIPSVDWGFPNPWTGSNTGTGTGTGTGNTSSAGTGTGGGYSGAAYAANQNAIHDALLATGQTTFTPDQMLTTLRNSGFSDAQIASSGVLGPPAYSLTAAGQQLQNGNVANNPLGGPENQALYAGYSDVTQSEGGMFYTAYGENGTVLAHIPVTPTTDIVALNRQYGAGNT